MTRFQCRHRLVPLATLAVLATLATSALADRDWKQQISRDYVKVKGDKFVLDEHDHCTYNPPERLGGGPAEKFQVRIYSEAPAKGVVSRDYFMALTTKYSTLLAVALSQTVPGLTLVEAIDALECRFVDEPVGPVDLEIRIVMSADDVQLETVNHRTKKSGRVTDTWAELFAPPPE